jgi:hypothetical protein
MRLRPVHSTKSARWWQLLPLHDVSPSHWKHRCTTCMDRIGGRDVEQKAQSLPFLAHRQTGILPTMRFAVVSAV